jgi:protein-L-isoaspartate O-methyltransferase
MPREPRLPSGPLAQFLEGYARRLSLAELAVEREVHGINAGITSYTTPAQAGMLADALALAPGVRVLDVGAGSGWPGVYLAKKTGCACVLTDVPAAAIRIAAARAAKQEVLARCSSAVASGTHLPFRAKSFDAVMHSDVLC